MSWTPETIIVSGYRVSRDASASAFEEYEKRYDDSSIEDFFIDYDPITNNNEIFFGTIIETISEDSLPVSFDSIIAPISTIENTKNWFHVLFDDYYSAHPEEEIPKYGKWIAVRWT